MSLRRNILIFHNAALGDFLMTWPVALALGRVFAQSRVMYVTASQKGQLAEKAIGIEAHDADAGWHALHGDGIALPPNVARSLAGLQLAVVFAKEPDADFERRIREAAGECTVLWINPNPPAGEHVWGHQLNELEKVPMLRQAVEQMQRLILSRGVQSPPGDPKRVIIHPGSGAPRKNWPIESFIEVARMLKAKKFDVVVTLGEVEREQFSPAILQTLQSVAEVKSCETTGELFDVIASAGIFIGNDSGPTHLAAMLGRKTIALFGPTSDAAAWKPMGPAVEMLTFDAKAADVVAKI